MKTCVIALSLLLSVLIFSDVVTAAEEHPTAASITTNDGKTYAKAKIQRRDGERVLVFYYEGESLKMVWIDLSNINDDNRVALGLQKKADEDEAKKKEKAEHDAFVKAQKEKGLVEYEGRWMKPEEAEAKEKAKKLAKANKKADELIDSKTAKEPTLFMIAQAAQDGALCVTAKDELFFLYGATDKLTADGEKYKQQLFWCGTIAVNFRGYRRTLNSYATTREAARELVVTKFNLLGEEEKAEKDEKDGKTEGDDNIKGSGSGFVLTADGYILTNYHVAHAGSVIKVKVGEQKLRATVVATDLKNDLAIIKIKGTFTPVTFPNNNEVKLGQSVFTVGFPMPKLQGQSTKVTKGVLSSLKGFQDDPRYIQIDASVQPGNSGGPLCNEFGQVIGVVSARLNGDGEIIAQNVNYAIRLSYVLAFIETVPDAQKQIKKTDPAKITFEDAVQNVQKSTVLIIIEE